jgi:hypothetical protein
MAHHIIESEQRQFFKELKKMKPKKIISVCVNGEMDEQRIANYFAEKYQNLYNSVPSENIQMESIKEKIQQKMESSPSDDVVITSETVIAAVRKLKKDKQYGNRQLFSNHLIYRTQRPFGKIATLLTLIQVHGHHPYNMQLVTLYSIPKDSRGDICDKDNYISIALISSLARTYDLVFLMRNSEKLKSSDLQYAFKNKHGTVMCTMVVKEFIHYYAKNKLPTIGCFFDASKTFNRVRYDRLFSPLLLGEKRKKESQQQKRRRRTKDM